MLKKISERVGFTPTEIKVIIFLLFVFAAGYTVKTFYLFRENESYRQYNYAAEDSLFLEIALTKDSTTAGKSSGEKPNYKEQVLGFAKPAFTENEPKIIPPEKSININSARIEDLMRLPGIGKKTAEKIVNFRKKIGRFTKLNELLQVKGIGNLKFNNIKKYIIIE